MDQQTQARYLEGMDLYLKGDYSGAIEIWEQILVDQPYNRQVLKAVAGAREKMAQGK